MSVRLYFCLWFSFFSISSLPFIVIITHYYHSSILDCHEDTHRGHDESDEYYFGYQQYRIARRERSPVIKRLLEREEDLQE